jgi:hypothetical protein
MMTATAKIAVVRGLFFGSLRNECSINSPTDHSLSVTPAAIAGGHRKVRSARTNCNGVV